MDKIELVKNAIRNAENLDSKLTQDILKIEGYSSPKVRHFLNNLINEDSTYLEIGTYKGSTLISALFQNDFKYAVAIDNFSLFGGPKYEFYNNIRKYISSEKLYFYDDSFENVDLSNFRFNTYFYDGEHEETDQYNAFLLMDKYLESDFIAIVDDYNWEKVQKGTKEAFRKLNYKVLYEQILPAHIVGDTENWWNGLYVAVIQKQPATPIIGGYCVVRNAEYLSYPFYDAIYQCLDNVDEFHIFYDVGSEDETISLTKKFVNKLRDYYLIEMHPIQVYWKDQSAISQAQNLGAQFLKEKGFEFVLLNQADEFLPVGMKEFLRECYRNKQQVGFDVIHTWKDEFIITTARYCRFYRSDTEFTGDGANVCGTEVKDFIMHKDPVHHFGTLFHPQRKYASHSKLYGSKDQEYIAANANDLDKVQEGFKRLIGTKKFIRRVFPLREREYITVRYSKEYGTYPFELALQEIIADFRRKRNCKESFAITYSNTQGFRESLAVSPAWTDAYGVVESLIKKFNIKTGAEIGVARGHHSAHLLEANPNLKWIAIDSWKHTVNGYEDPSNMPQEEFDETYESTRKLLEQFGDRITILRKTSREASEIVQEKLDIVFIDANHSYESVKEDIALWWNKVKPGGIIAGHDYDHLNYPGIKHAVDEFLGSKGLIPTIEIGTVWWAQKLSEHFLTYIVPCYNCAGTVIEAIKSIYQQNLDIPFEVICTEDGSTDSTRQILSYCQKKLPNFHVYYHDQNKGGATARNTCVANSRGDLIFCLDSDNILTPDSVGKLINLLDDTGCDGASFAELRYFEGTKGIYRHTNSWFFEAPNNICDISHILSTKKTPAASGNYLYTRESYDRAGGYPEGRGAMDSWGFGFRQHATGTKIAILPDSFYWHRLSSPSYWTREEKTGANSKNAASIVREFPELFTDETNSFLATAEAEKCFFRHLESGRLKTVSGQSLVCQSQDIVVSMKGPQGLLPVQNDGFNVGNLQARSDNAEIKPTSDVISRVKRTSSQQEGNHIRLHIGCGPRVLKGWVNIDLAFAPYENYMKYYTDEFYGPNVRGTKDDFLELDVTKDALPFADNSVDVIFNEDFIEHLDQKQIMLFLAETFRVLKPGGVHRVTTPDLMWIMQNYSDFSKGYSGVYQETWHKWHHKDHLTRRYLEDIAAMVGYQVIFQKRDVSLSPDIPKEYRPDKNNAPDEGHIFADLVKVESNSKSNVLDTKICRCNNLTYDAETMKSDTEFYEKTCSENSENIVQQLRRKGLLRTNQPLRLHLGCGEQHFDGYINIDYPPSEHNLIRVKADIYADIKRLNFPLESVDEIRLHHVFEHFNRVTALAMLIKWHEWLKTGGQLHIETPDLIGSAKTLVSDASWKIKIGVVRHLAGDQTASWGYHVDHWFAERFEHTLEALGFRVVEMLSTSWSKEPYLSNVKVVAIKSKCIPLQEQLKVAEKLLWESTVCLEEKSKWNVWKNQLHAVLAGDFVASPSNTQTPDVSSVSAAPIILSQNSSQLPLDEIHDFNQRTRNRWVQAKARTVPSGSRVLDVGAGTCPYRSFFAHCDYKTHDFKKYKGIKKNNTTEYGPIDYVSDITNIPVPDESFDVIICTEVLEHVPEPIEALREMARILKRGGSIFVTAPLGSGLHQLPYHYYGGLSPQWYRHFFPKFGLQLKEISPNGGFFKLLAQECARVAWTLPQHQHLHGNNVEFIRNLFKEWLPRYLFALDEKCFIDQFTVGYHVEAEKSPLLTIDRTDMCQTVGRNISRDPNMSRIGGLIFSKDRAMQLQATIESFLLHCKDEDTIDLVVLYKTSNELHGGQYAELKKKFSGINFVEESNFGEQVLSVIEKYDYILFLVDDNIFVKPFSVRDITTALQREKDAVGFSLRLGKNTNYCYPFSSQQALPQFKKVSKGILKYYWPDAEYDFGYPLEVSSSVYRCQDMLQLLNRNEFVNPNTLESLMNQNKNLYNSLPYLLTYEESVTFANPVNIVQNVYENKHGTINNYTSEELADCFSQGMEVDVEQYIGLTPNAAHQETKLHFKKDGDNVVRISVIVPCYNHAHYLPEAVESIVNQTYKHWECIIVNDGSSDNTTEVAKRLIAKHPDRNIRFIDKPNNTGLADTRNVGIETATSEWILPLDSDDMFERTFMQNAVDIIQQNKKVDIIFTNMQKFGAEHGEWIPSEYSQQKVMFENTMPYASLYRKELWQKVGGYDKLVGTIRQPEDWNFWISCSKHDPVVRRIAEKLFLYRVDHRSMYHKMIKPNREVSWALLASCHPDLYPPQALVDAWQLIANCPDNIYQKILIAPEKCPEYGLAYFWRALVNKKQGNIDDAMKDCRTSVERAKENDWQSAFVLMMWQKNQGNLVSAAKSLEKLLSIRPDFGWAEDILIRSQGKVRSNLKYWQQLQDNQYFEKHQYYVGPKAYGTDFETINKYTSLSKEMKIVIIGCGYGRETLLIAPHVKHVYGIDVNRTILDKADKFLAERGITNFTSVLAKDWKSVVPNNIDIVYSIVVFQHLTRDLVKDYVHGLAKKLSPNGKFLCQFADLANGTHDAELRLYEPNTRWSKTEIEELIQECGLAKNSIDTQDIPGKGSWHWAFFSKQGASRSEAKILFYFERIGNLNKISPAGTVIAILNFARALQSSNPDVEIHITGDLVHYPEQYESFRVIPLPPPEQREQLITDYDVVFFATHVRYFKGLTKPSGQIWVLWQHCWEADDRVSLSHSSDFDAVICLSEQHRSSLRNKYFGDEKFITIPNLIDTNVYSPKGVIRNNHSIMFAGGLNPHKCVHILLDAFRLVRQQVKDAELHIYGDGKMWRGGDTYGNELKSIKPEGAYFHGYVDNKDMPQIYSKHSILCLPSKLESFGLVTVEAQACGCVPVVHNVGGVAATLADGQTGLLYSPNTPEKLAETIIKAIKIVDDDPSVRQKAINFVRNTFSINRAAEYISKLWGRITIAKKVNTIRTLLEGNEIEQADFECEKLLQKNPNHPDVQLLHALIMLQQGNKPKANVAIGELLENFPNHLRALNDFGLMAMKAGDTEKALRYLTKAYKFNPWDKDTITNCYAMLTTSGKYRDAKMLLLNYLTNVGEDAQVLQLFREIDNLIANAGSGTKVVSQEVLNNRQDVYCRSSTSMPLVSIITPVYNGADYIGQTIESVLAQDYPNFELVIIDDGSTDNTKEIILLYNDERIRYLYQENKGVSSARNLAIKKAKGQYIMPLDADDMMTPDFIAKHLAEFEKHPNVDLVYCDVLLIDKNSNPIRIMNKPEYQDRRYLIRDLFRAGHPVVPFRLGIRRSVFDRIGFYDEDLLIGEDYDMMRRFVKAGLKEHHLSEPLHLRRMHADSLSGNYSAQKAKSHFDVIKRYIDTFAYNELFPDVAWDEIAPQMRQLHAKCLTAGTYLAIGQDYVKTKAMEYSRTAFDQACSELNDCLKIDPENRGLRQLLQKSNLIRARYAEAPQQVVSK